MYLSKFLSLYLSIYLPKYLFYVSMYLSLTLSIPLLTHFFLNNLWRISTIQTRWSTWILLQTWIGWFWVSGLNWGESVGICGETHKTSNTNSSSTSSAKANDSVRTQSIYSVYLCIAVSMYLCIYHSATFLLSLITYLTRYDFWSISRHSVASGAAEDWDLRIPCQVKEFALFQSQPSKSN